MPPIRQPVVLTPVTDDPSGRRDVSTNLCFQQPSPNLMVQGFCWRTVYRCSMAGFDGNDLSKPRCVDNFGNRFIPR